MVRALTDNTARTGNTLPATTYWQNQAPNTLTTWCASGEPSYEILSAFFYGRAFAVTLSKRLGEVVVDGISEVSKVIAEQPQWVQDFQVSGSQSDWVFHNITEIMNKAHS